MIGLIRLFFIGSVIASSLLVTPTTLARNVEGWDVTAQEDHCRMSSIFDGGTIIAIMYYPIDDYFSILVANDKWDSLAARIGETVRLDIKLDGDAVEYTSWWDEASLIVSSGGLDGVLGRWSSDDSTDFAVSTMLARSMQIQIDGRQIGSFDLSGTYAAIPATKKCASNVLKEIDDPFAQ